MAGIVRCPICRRPVTFDDPYMPFCSDRCRLIDLGNWASETYRIPASGNQLEESELDDAGDSDSFEGPRR